MKTYFLSFKKELHLPKKKTHNLFHDILTSIYNLGIMDVRNIVVFKTTIEIQPNFDVFLVNNLT